MKGLSCPPIKGKLSLRASITGMILMNDVHIPSENLLPNVEGLKVLLSKNPYLSLGSVLMPQQRPLRDSLGRHRRPRRCPGTDPHILTRTPSIRQPPSKIPTRATQTSASRDGYRLRSPRRMASRQTQGQRPTGP